MNSLKLMGILISLMLLGGTVFGQGEIVIRADISGVGAYTHDGVKYISPNIPFSIDIYASCGVSQFSRNVWSSPFTINEEDGASKVYFGNPDEFPRNDFLSYWDNFYTSYTESWDSILPNMYCFVGIATFAGLPSETGEFRALSISLTVPDTIGTICIDSGGNENYVYGWLFEDPVPSFTKQCWTIRNNPNRSPIFDNCPSSIVGEAGQLMTYDVVALDWENDTVLYSIASGPGTIDSLTGRWTYSPECSDFGKSLALDIAATDRFHSLTGSEVEHCLSNLIIGNSAPEISRGCDTEVIAGDYPSHAYFAAGDPDSGDHLSWSITAVDPVPSGPYRIDSLGILTYQAQLPEDQGKIINFTARVTDCGGLFDECSVRFNVAEVVPFAFEIGKLEKVLQGHHAIVPVIKVKGSEELWAFHFRIAFDLVALSLSSATPGVIFESPGPYEWEYFSYTYNPAPRCLSCPPGAVSVVGYASSSLTPPPSRVEIPDGTILFSVDFNVTNDRIWECQTLPLRFFWDDCMDNAILMRRHSDTSGRFVESAISSRVFDQSREITNLYDSFPTFNGAPQFCLDDSVWGFSTIRYVDFIDGQIDIICADTIDSRGDINLNGISNEIADLITFANWFLQGMSAFTINREGQIAATDINADGIVLTIEDYTYLDRIIDGVIPPFPKQNSSSSGSLNLVLGDTSLTVYGKFDIPIGAIFLNLHAPNLGSYQIIPGDGIDLMGYNLADDSLRILVDDSIGTEEQKLLEIVFSGTAPQLSYSLAAGYLGEVINLDVVNDYPTGLDEGSALSLPRAFALYQNYPNPFNPATDIRFALPIRTDWELGIYSIVGQKVRAFSGSDGAGYKIVRWDGTDNSGRILPTGIYFYRLTAGDFTASKKMLLLK
ncbi:hypothetical protein TRIP_C60395 [Candidatus Zixiibacteriota bacterium]|nr:hypothetical protein TRIP_C60395 [candidate division Zixibacteria bacterium]